MSCPRIDGDCYECEVAALDERSDAAEAYPADSDCGCGCGLVVEEHGAAYCVGCGVAA